MAQGEILKIDNLFFNNNKMRERIYCNSKERRSQMIRFLFCCNFLENIWIFGFFFWYLTIQGIKIITFITNFWYCIFINKLYTSCIFFKPFFILFSISDYFLIFTLFHLSFPGLKVSSHHVSGKNFYNFSAWSVGFSII